MRLSKNGLGWGSAAVLALAACSGKMHDVGDLPEGPGGQGNIGGEGLAGERAGSPPRAGSGGAAGAPNMTGDAGKGDQPHLEELGCNDCELVAESADIRDIASDADNVYWVEYGTFDSLGNYETNGRLLSAPLAGGEPVVLAANLEGPIGVEVSSSHIYVLVELASALIGGKQLLRFSLDGSDLQVDDTLHPTLGQTEDDYVYDWFQRKFFVNAGTAYILSDPMVYTWVEDEVGPTSPLYSMGTTQIYSIFGDASLLYTQHTSGISTVPYSGGTSTSLMTFDTFNGYKPRYPQLAIQDDYIYGLDSIGPNDSNALSSYVVRAPKAGGTWKRIAEYSGSLTHLRIDGSEYFVDPAVQNGEQVKGCSIVQGKLGDPTAKTTRVTLPVASGLTNPISDCLLVWDMSPGFVYFRHDERLYRMPRAD